MDISSKLGLVKQVRRQLSCDRNNETKWIKDSPINRGWYYLFYINDLLYFKYIINIGKILNIVVINIMKE